MFTENRRKETQKGASTPQKADYYISVLSARSNPDLLVSGNRFLKGNLYFSKRDEEIDWAIPEEHTAESRQKPVLPEEESG